MLENQLHFFPRQNNLIATGIFLQYPRKIGLILLNDDILIVPIHAIK